MIEHDGWNWKAYARVLKFSPEQVQWVWNRVGHEPMGHELMAFCAGPEDGISEAHGNLLVTVGLNRLTNLMIGGGATAFANASSLTGVGNVTTAATTADTQLGANSTGNSQYVVMDATYPTQSNGTISCQTTFTTGLGNFAWQEWGWVVAASPVNSVTFAGTGTSPVLINHKITSLGTKTVGATWVFQTSATLA